MIDPNQITSVRRRLLQVEGLHKLPLEKLDVFLMRDFVSVAESCHAIKMIDSDRRPSGLLVPSPDPEFRTSETHNFGRADLVISAIQHRVDRLLGIPTDCGETIQGQRYGTGQQFKPHHDFFHVSQPYWATQQRMGGQRTWTAMVFLNEPEAGGQTFFPEVGLRVSPRRGNLLIWANVDEQGEPNHASLHQGMPVERGVKYVLTKWYRERKWCEHPLAANYEGKERYPQQRPYDSHAYIPV